MSNKLRLAGAVTLIGLMAGVACSGDDAGDEENKAGGSNAGTAGNAAGKGGTAGKGGKSGTAGKSPTAGSGGKVSTAGGAAGAEPGPGGAAGAGGDGPACPGCASGFCLDDGTCVECLPANDHCPQGQYCTEINECEPGCKADGSSCASGICDAEHNCTNCINDDECLPGMLCGAGKCSDPCVVDEQNQSTTCDASLLCCSEHCVDVKTDSNHCGACGSACDSGDFCGISDCSGAGGAGGSSGSEPCVTCQPTVLGNVCSVSQVIVMLDTTKNPSDGNRKPGRAIGHALADSCASQPIYSEAEQDSVDALNLTTGRPVSNSGELLVVAGGPFFMNLEGYLEEQRISRLYLNVVGSEKTEFRRSSDDAVVLTLPVEGDHDSHDFFIIQFSRDPESGSLVLNAQGFWLSGTVAAAYLLTNQTLPNVASYTEGYYAYEWTDGNGDKAPDLNEIELVSSGD
jgi:hypothetical protein